MNNGSLIPEFVKKTLEPLRDIEKSLSNLWNKTPSISYIEEGVYLPAIDIDERENAYHVTADFPGVEGKDVRIEFNNGTLTMRGEKKTQREEDRSQCHISEQSNVQFNHMIELPNDVDERNITATLENGVIKVTLAKSVATDRRGDS
jgi:HSP20 family molecular chaperone IbpA